MVKLRPFQVLVREMCRGNPSLINQLDPIKARTPLHLALQAVAMPNSGPVKSWEEIIDVLLSAGANTSKVDGAGNTCLHLLAPGLDRCAAYRALFQRFLNMGLDVNEANIKGETPAFHYLGNKSDRRKKAWEWLVDRGADPAAKDSTGRGLLHVVAENEKDVVLFAKLVEKWGPDPMAVENERMMSSLDVAAACSNSAVISLFERGEGGGMVDKAVAVADNFRKYEYVNYNWDKDED
ncbi:hypothetical protein QBC40DRAFT_351779 [Triangularia verruculosa]|uniref:Ankyrin n=1 Tax=Triangularia verruculosa TaxID=2587418 RepID=A0AAN6X986_9PEZI|nr:hypothetical protein QBC40DRAFT_351779 [Triangularia verruculosa]